MHVTAVTQADALCNCSMLSEPRTCWIQGHKCPISRPLVWIICIKSSNQADQVIYELPNGVIDYSHLSHKRKHAILDPGARLTCHIFIATSCLLLPQWHCFMLYALTPRDRSVAVLPVNGKPTNFQLQATSKKKQTETTERHHQIAFWHFKVNKKLLEIVIAKVNSEWDHLHLQKYAVKTGSPAIQVKGLLRWNCKMKEVVT